MSDSDTTSFEDPSTREIVLAVVPKITGALSLCSSGWIAYNVLSDRHRRTKTYHQLLALMSLCDMVGSFAYFLSTWPIPQGLNMGWKKNSHIWASGNDATCTAQAVGIQWGVTTAFLNVALSAHYLLVIRYHATERSLQKYSPYVMVFALLVGLGLTVPGIFLGIYGNTNLWCWIAPDFAACEEEGLSRDDCTQRAYNYRWAFYYGPIWTCIILITAVQAALLLSIFKIEHQSSRWNAIHTSRQRRYRQSAKVTTQACWYVGIFYVTWLPYTAIAMTGKFFNPDTGFAVLFLVVLCQPSQGFLNLFAYQRHRIFAKCAGCFGCGVSGGRHGSGSRLLSFFVSSSMPSTTAAVQGSAIENATTQNLTILGKDSTAASAAVPLESEAAAIEDPEAVVQDGGGAIGTDKREKGSNDESDCLLEEIYGD